MPLIFDDQQQDFMRTVDDVLQRSCSMHVVREIANAAPERWRDVWSGLVEIGLPALLIPEAADGLGLTPVDMVAVLEAAGAYAAPVPLAVTVGGFVPLLLEAGGVTERTRPILADVLAGAGGTVAIASSASLRDGRLTARCDPIPEIGRAEYIAVVVSLQDADPVLVVGSAEALGVRPEPAMDPSSPVGVVDLTDADVSHLLVLERDPTPALPILWAALSAEMVGLAAELVARSISYARDRVQFSKPIGSFQAVKHLLVDTHLAVERARSLMVYAAALTARRDPRAAPAAHNAKAAASEAATAAARAAVQVHGSAGITKEQDVSLLYLRARQLSQLFGAPDEHYARSALAAVRD